MLKIVNFFNIWGEGKGRIYFFCDNVWMYIIWYGVCVFWVGIIVFFFNIIMILNNFGYCCCLGFVFLFYNEYLVY